MLDTQNSAKNSKGQQTRTLLLEAALHQFAARGYHGTSMRQIAEAAGVAVGGIYNHFASKEELLKAVILAYHPLTVVAPTLATVHSDQVEVLIRHIAHGFHQVLQARPELLKLMLIEIVECKGEHLPDVIGALYPQIITFVQRLQAANRQLRPLPPLVILRALLSTLLGFFITESLLAKNFAAFSDSGSVDQLVDILLHGLLRSEAGKQETGNRKRD